MDIVAGNHSLQSHDPFPASTLPPSRSSINQIPTPSVVLRNTSCPLPCNISHSQFTKAVEMKQVAEQDAERAKFVVMKAEQERNAAIIRAEGESESAKLISLVRGWVCYVLFVLFLLVV